MFLFTEGSEWYIFILGAIPHICETVQHETAESERGVSTVLTYTYFKPKAKYLGHVLSYGRDENI
jgi:hypothetical protein